MSDAPSSGRPPPAGLFVALIGASALVTATIIVLFLTSVPMPVRVLLAVGELLVTSLACWAILKTSRR